MANDGEHAKLCNVQDSSAFVDDASPESLLRYSLVVVHEPSGSKINLRSRRAEFEPRYAYHQIDRSVQ